MRSLHRHRHRYLRWRLPLITAAADTVLRGGWRQSKGAGCDGQHPMCNMASAIKGHRRHHCLHLRRRWLSLIAAAAVQHGGRRLKGAGGVQHVTWRQRMPQNGGGGGDQREWVSGGQCPPCNTAAINGRCRHRCGHLRWLLPLIAAVSEPLPPWSRWRENERPLYVQ